MRELYSVPGHLFKPFWYSEEQDFPGTNEIFRSWKNWYSNPNINAADGTVDVLYGVEETSSDQLELSGGWGYNRLIVHWEFLLIISLQGISLKRTHGHLYHPVTDKVITENAILWQRLPEFQYFLYGTLAGWKETSQFSVSAYVSSFNNGLATVQLPITPYNILDSHLC